MSGPEHSPDTNLEFIATAIVSNDVILKMGRHEGCTLDVPSNLDIAAEWEIYSQCGGRINVQNGDTFDHKSVSFRDWLIRKGARTHYPDAFAGLKLAVFPER